MRWNVDMQEFFKENEKSNTFGFMRPFHSLISIGKDFDADQAMH